MYAAMFIILLSENGGGKFSYLRHIFVQDNHSLNEWVKSL